MRSYIVTCHSTATRQNCEVSAVQVRTYKNEVAHSQVVCVLVAQHEPYSGVVHLHTPPNIITAT